MIVKSFYGLPHHFISSQFHDSHITSSGCLILSIESSASVREAGRESILQNLGFTPPAWAVPYLIVNDLSSDLLARWSRIGRAVNYSSESGIKYSNHYNKLQLTKYP